MPQPLSTAEIRSRFLAFFEAQQHRVIPSASVIPENDPTLLFVNSGMYPLIPYLLGEDHPEGTRLADSQKCIRTIDIDEVGDNRHLTFFEMLGFWSLGDYFKEDTIKWTYEFMTNPETGLGLEKERLYVTCYEGRGEIPKDTEAAQIWIDAGMPEDRIYYLGKNNWWDLPSKTSPCGPSTEIFYDVTGELGDMTHDEFVEADESGQVVEIGNDVFMTYQKDGNNGYNPLPKKNVDVGWGLERLAMVVQGAETVFETDIFQAILERISEVSGKPYEGEYRPSMRIIADHLRTATVIIGDPFGIGPSNMDQGYIVRRLIRRAIREGRKLGLQEPFTTAIAQTVIDAYKEAYPEFGENTERIMTELQQEEEKFSATLEKGMKEFEKILEKDAQSISGKDAFILFSTYGFPLEMTVELARERGANVDEMSFDAEFEQHQNASRAGAAKKFKGGLADHSIESRRLHTATHLLHKALKNLLGEEVEQKGSNITPDRLRFDFNYPDKLTDEQKQQLEDMVNAEIQKAQPVYWRELDVEDAKAAGAIGYFDDEYARLGNKVKVYYIGEGEDIFAVEICGGPHVENTSELGSFTINSEKSSSAGIRRIKATVSANQK